MESHTDHNHDHTHHGHHHHHSHGKNNWALPISIVVAGLLIGAGLFFGLSTRGGSAVDPSAGNVTKSQMKALLKANVATPINDSPINNSGDIYIGKASAPLTMTYWFDYQCPFCKRFEDNVIPNLITDYVNTGKLKIVFKDFPFLGNDSMTGA
jgi:protein-disulfide isomerase